MKHRDLFRSKLFMTLRDPCVLSGLFESMGFLLNLKKSL